MATFADIEQVKQQGLVILDEQIILARISHTG